ncbi:MAG: hypothetical protein FWB85_02695 [Chitinispirillia bacterium]|nr:hypothetical protein [Chitinispirillia bacterium]MCL2241332.1 hypothetical protein [Chitinispirillia bacterium]
MLTKEKLTEIRERAEKATPGPWGNGLLANGVYTMRGNEICSFDGERNKQSNSHFVANARTDIPALLEHIAGQDYILEAILDVLYKAKIVSPYKVEEADNAS